METNDLILAMTHVIVTATFNGFCLWLFANYRLNRKWPAGKVKGVLARCEKYWFEIVITVVVVPQWPETIRAALLIFAPSPAGG